VNPLKRFKWLVERGLHLGGYGCTDTETLLFEYVQGELPEPTRRKLDRHLADCPGCVRYVSSYRKTIQATHDHGCPKAEIPREMQRRLHDFIRQNPNLR
jgi:anti-sigma factor RsiW